MRRLANAVLSGSLPAARATSRTDVGRRLVALGVLTAALLMLSAGSALGELRRTTVTTEFGPDGTSATSFPGKVVQLDFNEASGQLVALSESPSEIHTFQIGTPGTHTPVPGGNFPAGADGLGSGGMTVDPATGNVYVALFSFEEKLRGFTPTGANLPGFPIEDFPVPVCGTDINSQGELFVGTPWEESFQVMTPFGEPLRRVILAGSPCAIEFDPITEDLYSVNNGGGYPIRSLYQYEYDPPRSITLPTWETEDMAFDQVTNRLLATSNFIEPHLDEDSPEGDADTSTEEADPLNRLILPDVVRGVAVAPDGTAYVGLGNRIVEIPLAAIPLVTTGESIGAAEVSGVVDSNGAGPITDCHFQWGTSTEYKFNTEETPCAEATPYSSEQPVTAELPGLTPGTTYHYRVVAGNANRGGFDYGEDETITPPLVEALSTDPATEVTRTSATLNASFNGNGSETLYYFKWGPGPGVVNTAPASPPASAGTTSGHTEISQGISGLQPQTTYYYRIVATNSAGTSEGKTKTFKTQGYAIDTTTKPATGISQDSVTLNGEFFGTGEPASYYFEWGPTAAYGDKAPGTPVDAGEASGTTPVAAQITSFKAYSTYHYRLVVTNTLGTSKGEDMTFTTLPAPLPGIADTGVEALDADSATFSATITPNRWETVYLFEYGPSNGYGSSSAVGGPLAGENTGSQPVSLIVDGLTPGTIYHFRAVATNFTGTVYGPDQTFLTPGPPTLDAAGASSIASGSAVLSALIGPNMRATALHFDYGPTEAYGSQTRGQAVGDDGTRHPASTTLTGLSPATTYHFRAVATNELGTVVSSDQTFTTLSAPSVLPRPQPSACGRGLVKRSGKCVPKRCKRGFAKRRGKCVRKNPSHRQKQRRPKAGRRG